MGGGRQLKVRGATGAAGALASTAADFEGAAAATGLEEGAEGAAAAAGTGLDADSAPLAACLVVDLVAGLAGGF
jgi:hypothetical protein